MRFLRRLYLSDNLIGDIARGTFSGVPKVGTIDLARNFIKKIDYQMFDDLKFIEVGWADLQFTVAARKTMWLNVKI